MSQAAAKPRCCPPFDPSKWNDETHVWREKLFMTDNVVQLFHIPLNIGRVIRRMWDKAVAAKVTLPAEDTLLMAYDPSPWKSELFLSVSRDVPGARHVRLSGTFVSRVFEGPYHAVPKWLREMDARLEARGSDRSGTTSTTPIVPSAPSITGRTTVSSSRSWTQAPPEFAPARRACGSRFRREFRPAGRDSGLTCLQLHSVGFFRA